MPPNINIVIVFIRKVAKNNHKVKKMKLTTTKKAFPAPDIENVLLHSTHF